jgi:hypothetical protein
MDAAVQAFLVWLRGYAPNVTMSEDSAAYYIRQANGNVEVAKDIYWRENILIY